MEKYYQGINLQTNGFLIIVIDVHNLIYLQTVHLVFKQEMKK